VAAVLSGLSPTPLIIIKKNLHWLHLSRWSEFGFPVVQPGSESYPQQIAPVDFLRTLLGRKCSSSFLLTSLVEDYFWGLPFSVPCVLLSCRRQIIKKRIKRRGKKEANKTEMKKKSHA
jgi:hypothetical protein